MNLGSRFTLLFALLAFSAGLLLVVLLDSTVRRAVEDRVAERLVSEAEHLASDLAIVPAGDLAARDRFLREAARTLSCRITLVDAEGRVLHETGLSPADVERIENHADREEIRGAMRLGSGRSRRFSDTLRQEMFYVARRLADPAGRGGVLRLAVSTAHLRETEKAYLWSARAAVLGACLLLFLLGAAVSRRFSTPIRDLTEAASAIASGEFARELPQTGSEEVQRLSSALRRMKASLSGAVERAESERCLTSIVFESLPDALVVVDSGLRVLEANEAFSRMIDLAAPAGRGLYEVLRHRALLDVFDVALRTGKPASDTVRLDDEKVWLVNVQPLPAGSRGAAVGVLRDVSRLERTEAMRRTFVADVSHELRTPIAAIGAAAETLAEGGTGEDSAELVAVVRRQAERMRELIDDLMDLAQIESGAVVLERDDLALLPLLTEVVSDLEPAAREKAIDVTVAGEPLTVRADRRRLGQVVRNLLDNAIKFSPRGARVELAAFRDAAGPGFSVSDRGPGIPRGEREKIFQRFYQIDRSRSKARPGSGLGLSIVKHLVHLHGGSIELESATGEGSRFVVRLPS